MWSRDGRNLFYRSNGQLVSATIRPGPAFAVASRSTLFTDDYIYAGNPHANYDVALDNGSFIFLKPATEGNMIVVSNWKSILRQRMSK